MFDPRGNPVSTRSAEAITATERALWRMMSFYGTPIGDLDAAIAVDPVWPQSMLAAGCSLMLNASVKAMCSNGRAGSSVGQGSSAA